MDYLKVKPYIRNQDAFFEKSSYACQKFINIVNFYKEINLQGWYYSYQMTGLESILFNQITLTMDLAIVCIEFVDYEYIKELISTTITNIQIALQKCHTFPVKMYGCLMSVKINQFVLDAAYNLEHDQNMEYAIDQFDDYWRTCDISRHMYILVLVNKYMMATSLYEELKGRKQKFRLIEVHKNIQDNPDDSSIQSVMACDDLVRFMCEYI